MKPLEPKTSHVGMLLWLTSQKKKIILGFDLTFQTQEIGEVQRFKGFNPLALTYATLRENEPLLEKAQVEES